MFKVILLICGTVVASALKSTLTTSTHAAELAEAAADLTLAMAEADEALLQRKAFPSGDRIVVDAKTGKKLAESTVEDYTDGNQNTCSGGCGSFGRCWSSCPCKATWSKGGSWCYTTSAFYCNPFGSDCMYYQTGVPCNPSSSCY